MTTQMGPSAPKHSKPGLFASLRSSFLTGVVIAAPLFITFAVVYWAITGPLNRLDGFVQSKIPQRWLPDFLVGVSIVPGFGVLVAVILLVILGMLAKNIIGRFFIAQSERLLDSLPLVRNLYGFFKNVFEMALQQSEQSFKEVALIEYPRPGLWSICFVVTSTKGEVKHSLEDVGDGMINVFVPTTPNPTSGFLLFVPRSDLRPLSMSVEDGAKMIFSAGLVSPPYFPDGEPVPTESPTDSSSRGFRFLRRKSAPPTREAEIGDTPDAGTPEDIPEKSNS